MTTTHPVTVPCDGFELHVTRKSIKNLYLRVKPPQGIIEISAPLGMSDRRIIEFVRGRRGWIDEQRRRIVAAHDAQPGPDNNGTRRGFAWTRERKTQAAAAITALLPRLLAAWEPVISRHPAHITLRIMSSRWGSCTPKTGRIRLNLQLGLMDPKFLEYVLVHEMTHLWVNGHGLEFQRLMTAYLPQWRQLRRELNRQIVW